MTVSPLRSRCLAILIARTIAAVLNACSDSPAPTPTPTTDPAVTYTPTRTAVPTFTPADTRTPEPTDSPTMAPTASSVPAVTPIPNPVSTATPTPTPTPMPEPTPVVLGDCLDGMRLQPGEGCRYIGGGSPQANVVLSVQQDGAICREGGPAKQFGFTIDNLRICASNGFERDDAFQSEIVASANADGSWTFYESRLSASRPRATPTPIPTATPTPEPTAAPTATPVRPGKFSEFNGAGATTWRRMHEGGQIVACYEGLALPRDSAVHAAQRRFIGKGLHQPHAVLRGSHAGDLEVHRRRLPASREVAQGPQAPHPLI